MLPYGVFISIFLSVVSGFQFRNTSRSMLYLVFSFNGDDHALDEKLINLFWVGLKKLMANEEMLLQTSLAGSPTE